MLRSTHLNGCAVRIRGCRLWQAPSRSGGSGTIGQATPWPGVGERTAGGGTVGYVGVCTPLYSLAILCTLSTSSLRLPYSSSCTQAVYSEHQVEEPDARPGWSGEEQGYQDVQSWVGREVCESPREHGGAECLPACAAQLRARKGLHVCAHADVGNMHKLYIHVHGARAVDVVSLSYACYMCAAHAGGMWSNL